ncbi:MAG TPA: hemolysin III family protein [Thermoanaerobaculia bacterium]|nr:hemolysin III family protein [Thermoanaerobaculia bacterium]
MSGRFADAAGGSLPRRAARRPEVGYTLGEEIANSITHGLGVVLAIAALGMLCTYASLRGTVWHVVGCTVFAATLILLYTASTLYHSVPSPRLKPILRAIDHSAIFLLIAGTYTPFTLVNLRGPWGWTLFGVIWGLAVVGILLRAAVSSTRRRPFLALYLAMGWAVVVAIEPLVESVAPGGIALLVAGGLAYTAGVFFYRWRTLPYHHAIWHAFVLAGSTLHFFAVLLYVIPVAGS